MSEITNSGYMENSDYQNQSNHQKEETNQDNYRRPPMKKMTRFIYHSYKENNPPKGWVREELIQPN